MSSTISSSPSIGYHCGSGPASNGKEFPSFLTNLHGLLPRFSACQIFAASPKSFAHCAWTPETCLAVSKTVANLGIKLFIHAPYIINPCAWDDTAGSLNTDGLRLLRLVVNLLQKGAAMGASGVVIHVGKSLKLGETEGLRRMRWFFSSVLEAARDSGLPCCRLLLETCAGQGTEVARDLKVFGAFIKEMVGIYGSAAFGCCVDTCHVFACGYKIGELAAVIDKEIGWSNVGVIHLNDSQTACCAHVDRHANIGEGKIGKDELAKFCRETFAASPLLPFVFETPENEDGTSRLIEMTWFNSLF